MNDQSKLTVNTPARDVSAAPGSQKLAWAGRIVSALPALLLIFSGVMKLARPAPVLEGFAQFGYSESVIIGIGIVELACVAIYLIPRTAVLGAILLTGYLGGAVATHVRVADPYYGPIIVGILVWGGLYLRDARLRAILPLRK
jgi:hypothetical protein